MMRTITIFAIILFFISCDSDEKAIDFVFNNVRRGAVLRTVDFNTCEFKVNEPNSLFSVNLEEQDELDGGRLQDVTVYASFIDNSEGIGAENVDSIVIDTITSDQFTPGVNNLPVFTLEYSFEQLATSLGLAVNDIFCKDQFRIDLDLNLTNGEVFNLENSSGTVVNTTGFFKSPFTYLINVVEPIAPDLFTGVYQYTSVEDGFFGPSFGPDQLFSIVQGHDTNVRVFQFDTGLIRTVIEFSVVCDGAVVTRYQRLPTTCTGTAGVGNSDTSDRVLLGPDSTPGLLDPTDDTVFELWFLEAFEGFDAQCNYENFPSKIRLSKQ